MIKIKGKRGDILIGDVIFIVLNLVFLTILILFVVTKTNDAARLEEIYAKQIALMIDSAKPGMILYLDMEDAIEEAIDENQNIATIASIEGNVVTVKLRDKGGYSYSFFNDANVSIDLDTLSNEQEYVIKVNEKRTA